MKKLYLLLMFSTSFLLNAQEIITGKISDCDTNEPLPGAIVYISYIHKGVVSDENGYFQCLKVQKGYFDLTVSLLGYQTEIITVDADSIENEYHICLKEQIFETQEVIISGNKHSLQHENATDIQSVKLDIYTELEPNFLNNLAKQPGIDMISKGNGLQKPVIRGLSNTNILIIDNGIRKENYQFSENHPFLIDDNGTERIEIIKGPASLLYGSDAVGGVIFLVPEKTTLQNTTEGGITGKYSMNDKGLATKLFLKGAGTKAHYGINFGLKSFTDYFDADNIQVPNSRFNTLSIKANAGFSYKIGKTDVFADYNKTKIGMTVPGAVALIKKNERNNDIWYQDLNSKIIAVKNKIFFHRLMFDADLSYQANRRKLFTVGEEHEEEHEHHEVDMNLTTYSYLLKATYSISNTMQFIPGIQGMYQTNTNFEAHEHIIPDASLIDLSLFALFTGNYYKKLHISTGIRFDHRHIITVEEESRAEIERTYDNISYSSGFTWQVSDKLLFRSNFASAHRTPNIAELTQNGSHGAVFELGNPDLKTQVNYEPDLSFHYHGDCILFEVSGYYNFIKRFIWLGNTGLFSDSELPIYQYSQTDASINGFETGLKIMPLNFIKLFASYSFINALKADGSYLPFIPQKKIRNELIIHPKKKIIGLNVKTKIESVYAFDQTHISEFETETDSYFVLDWNISFERKLKKNSFVLALKISNLLNESYIDHLSTLKPFGYYSQGRNTSVVIKYEI